MSLTRKTFTIVAVLASALMTLANKSSNESRPNILVLYADDLDTSLQMLRCLCHQEACQAPAAMRWRRPCCLVRRASAEAG